MTETRIPNSALKTFVWAASTSNTYIVSIIDHRAGYDSGDFPRRELARYRFPCPVKPNGWPDLDAGYREASMCAHGINETLKRQPRLIRRIDR